MTQDIDLLSTQADVVAQELCVSLRQRFHIAVGTRRVGAGQGLRVFQVLKSGNLYLPDLRSVEVLLAAGTRLVLAGFPLRNPALLFAPASGIGLATAFTGILAPPSVECIVPSASVEPIPSPTADQRILSATSTNQVVTT